MKIVDIIITQPVENNTSSMIRCLQIMKELPKMGYRTICYCPYPDINGKYNNGEVKLEGIEIRRFGSTKKIQISNRDIKSAKNLKQKCFTFVYICLKKFDVFGSSLQYLKYTSYIKKMVRKDECDILLTFSDPMTSHMIGKFCAKVIKGVYIQQWGDPLAADVIAKTALPKWIRKIIERNLIKNADKICYVSPLTLNEQKKMFKKYANRMFFLPTPSVKYNNCKRKKNDVVKVGYFGSYNLSARDIRPLYDAIQECKLCNLYLIGDSDIELIPQKNIIIKDRVAREKIEEYLEEMDVLVCLMNSKGNQIPGKMYHYAGSYKEILVIKDGEYGDKIEDYFSQFDRYSFVENKKNEILNVLNDYLKNGIPSRKPLDCFDANIVAKQLIND